MEKVVSYHLNVEIDRLTNSVQNTISGDSFPTEVFENNIMELITEPEGIDLNLAPLPLSEEERREISAIIAEYRKSGKIPKVLRKKRETENLKAADTSNPPSTGKTVRKKAQVVESEG